ncbi:MAG: BMP family ABC transporter substrate-binding protein [Chloroflexota bacterium]|nr:BMP family ABC transporter substrate-binding protein [Chloroflexota bacterium]
MRNKLFLIFSLLIVASMLFAACGGEEATEAPPPAEETIKVVHLVNGVLGDKSFFDSAERGVRQAEEEFNYTVKTIEAGIDPARWEPALEDAAANEEYDIMIVGTYQMAEFLQNVAPKYPDKMFIIYDVSVDYEACEGCDNVYSVLYMQNEGSYLAGLYAGLMTQEEVEGINDDLIVGVVGGQDIPVINDFIVGYQQGAADAGLDPTSGVIIQYAGSWNDPAKGKEITLTMYQQGADIVFSVAGGTGVGIFQAAEEAGSYALGVDSDQATIIADTDPDQAEHILTSMLKNVDNSLYRALKMYVEGTLPFGSAENLGVAAGGVGLAYNEWYEKNTPQSVKDAIAQAEQDILDGKIIVDTVFE